MSILLIVDINFLSESNGISASLLYLFFKFKIDIPLLSVASKIAISVGSPIGFFLNATSFVSSTTPSVHNDDLINISFLNSSNSSKFDNSLDEFNVQSLTIVILLIVKVPVLSEQITAVEPKVSTEGNFLISAFFLVIFFTPIERTIVTIAVNPSGIAIAAREIDSNNEDCTEFIISFAPKTFSIANSENKKVIKVKTIPKIPKILPICCIFNCKGDNIFLLSFNRFAILPISVLFPIW